MISDHSSFVSISESMDLLLNDTALDGEVKTLHWWYLPQIVVPPTLRPPVGAGVVSRFDLEPTSGSPGNHAKRSPGASVGCLSPDAPKEIREPAGWVYAARSPI